MGGNAHVLDAAGSSEGAEPLSTAVPAAKRQKLSANLASNADVAAPADAQNPQGSRQSLDSPSAHTALPSRGITNGAAQPELLEDQGLPDDDEDGDLMVVKRHNVLADDGDADGDAAGDAAGDPSAAKKPKKLRIKVGKASGTRVEFDESGAAQDPLSLLAVQPVQQTEGWVTDAVGDQAT